MQTVLRSPSKEVALDTAGTVVIIGEKLNPTGHKKMALALQEGDMNYLRDLAQRQVAAGAEVLDLNVGVAGLDDVAMMVQALQVVTEAVKVPLCIDSPNPRALEAGLAAYSGRALVNSVSGEESRLEAILPLVKAHDAAVIGLTLDDNGIPITPEGRLAVADKIVERAARLGIRVEDIVIDPLVMSVGTDSQAGMVTLNSIRLIREKLGVNINLGASNVSFGLPDRPTINATFLALAIGVGASCVISDPLKMTGVVRAADLLLGRDEYSARYIRYFRSLPKEPVK